MEFMPFANDGQGFLFFEDFQYYLEFKLGCEFTLTFAVHEVKIRLEIQLSYWYRKGGALYTSALTEWYNW